MIQYQQGFTRFFVITSGNRGTGMPIEGTIVVEVADLIKFAFVP